MYSNKITYRIVQYKRYFIVIINKDYKLKFNILPEGLLFTFYYIMHFLIKLGLIYVSL